MAKRQTNQTTKNVTTEVGEPIYLTGIAYYFFATHADTKFNPEGRYKLNLIPDEASLKLARENGINVNPPKTNIPGEWITASSQFPPFLIDAERTRIEGSFIVGNGSKVRIKAAPVKFSKGVGLRLLGAQILTLVPYERKELEGGFTKHEGDYVFDGGGGGNAAEETAF